LKLQYDEPLSISAFNFNLRRYHSGVLMVEKQLVRPRNYWSPRHQHAFDPSIIELNGIL